MMENCKSIVDILFYIKNSKIKLYEYRDESFESIQDCGEDIIEYSDGFMDWFKNAIAYIKEIQKLDYLIITDNSVTLEFRDFDTVNNSSWNKEKLKKFSTSVLKDSSIILKTPNNKKYFSFNEGKKSEEYTVLFCDKVVNKKKSGLKSEIEKQIEKKKSLKEKSDKNDILDKDEFALPDIGFDDINLDDIDLDKKVSCKEEKIESDKIISTEEVYVNDFYEALLREEENKRKKLIYNKK